MESEVNEFAVAIGAPLSEKSDCNDVLLPSDSVSTNGISNLSATGAINFLDEGNDVIQADESGEEIDANDKDEEIDEDIEEEEEVDLDADNEEGVEYDDEDMEGVIENSLSPQKECAQLPKKRKFAPSSAILAVHDEEGEVEGEGELEGEDEYEEEEEGEDDMEAEEKVDAISNEISITNVHDDELPTSSARVAANKENTVDEDICRVCTTKDNLVSLFKRMETKIVADLLMLICPTVSIARKDFMPQYICQTCLDNVNIAVQLKTQCESTERELRKKLSRHKNKVRRPSGYVVIDAPVESDPEDDEDEPADDVEFKVSDEEVSPSADESDTDDSDFGSKKKRPMRGGGTGGRRGRRKSSFAPTQMKEKRPKGRPPKRLARSSDDEFMAEKRKKDPIGADISSSDFPCDECEQVFTRKLSLVLHKKTHSQSDPIICNLCGKHFKIKGAYRTHMERHRTELSSFTCGKCDLFFTTKTELKKHQAEEHNPGKDSSLMCQHCKRAFVSEVRLQRHLENYCPSSEQAQKQRKSEYGEHSTTGKDLFKTVAPLTTTYWSDSFSD